MQCEYFALEGLGKLLNTIKIVQSKLNMETKTFVPPDFYCPISGELMMNPVIGKDGHSYEKTEILKVFLV